MPLYNPLLIIKQLQSAVDRAVGHQQIFFFKYRQKNGGNALHRIGQNRYLHIFRSSDLRCVFM